MFQWFPSLNHTGYFFAFLLFHPRLEMFLYPTQFKSLVSDSWRICSIKRTMYFWTNWIWLYQSWWLKCIGGKGVNTCAINHFACYNCASFTHICEALSFSCCLLSCSWCRKAQLLSPWLSASNNETWVFVVQARFEPFIKSHTYRSYI